MIKQSSLLKWTQNSKNVVKGSGRNWIHPAEALQKGHVAYLVKFLGHTEVDQPKGIDVVKEGIRKLKFSQQLKRSEGTKVPKVELTISVDGVAIQDPKTKVIFYQHPLHRISYCADDKSDKKFFSFIAKEAEGDSHSCFVFASEKLAEEITLTIGQAFDLAYRRFLETSGRDLEMKKQFMILQKRVQELEKENSELRSKLKEYETVKDKLEFYSPPQLQKNSNTVINGQRMGIAHLPPPIPPRQPEQVSTSQDLIGIQMPAVGRKLENLVIDDIEFNPRAEEVSAKSNGCNDNTSETKDLFGAEPFTPTQQDDTDPFGMSTFSSNSLGAKELESAIGIIDKRLTEMRDGFSRGLSFGNDDFSIEALDPLSKPSQPNLQAE